MSNKFSKFHMMFSTRVHDEIIELLLGKTKLDLQRLGHLWGRGAGQSQLNFHTIIDEPLQSGQGTDHNDPRTKTGPHTAKAKGLGGRANGGALGLVHVGHNGVGRVGHDGAEHASNVTSSECYDELLALGALGAGLGHNVGVQQLHGTLKAGKLHHCVRNLTSPQGAERLVETVDALLGVDLGGGAAQCCGECAGQ